MIQVIGTKRIVILLIFALLNIALGVFLYFYMIPQKEKAAQDVRVMRSKVSKVNLDLQNLEVEFQQLDAQQDRFKILEEDGFFSTQIRSEAKELFTRLQKESKVISAVVSVKSGTLEDSVDAQKTFHKVLTSPINIEIKAFDDTDIYNYIELAERHFPGHLSIDRLSIKRSQDSSSALLRSIATGATPVLVSATLNVSWRTMIPEAQIIADDK